MEPMTSSLGVLADEAAASGALWSVNWSATRQRLAAARGEQAIAAAAAFLLVGDQAAAKAVLAQDPALGQGDLLRRREALFGRTAAVLTFDDPGDLQAIEVLQGEPRLEGGVLTGLPNEAVGISCVAPVQGPSWEALVGLALTGGTGQAVVTLVSQGAPVVMLRVETSQMVLRVDGRESTHPRPPGALALRVTKRGGTVAVAVGDSTLREVPAAGIPDGALLRVEVAGLTWALTDLQVIAGP